jgi:hypothetical protein
MRSSPALSIILVGVGVGLLAWGLTATDSLSSQTSELFQGAPGNKAIAADGCRRPGGRPRRREAVASPGGLTGCLPPARGPPSGRPSPSMSAGTCDAPVRGSCPRVGPRSTKRSVAVGRESAPPRGRGSHPTRSRRTRARRSRCRARRRPRGRRCRPPGGRTRGPPAGRPYQPALVEDRRFTRNRPGALSPTQGARLKRRGPGPLHNHLSFESQTDTIRRCEARQLDGTLNSDRNHPWRAVLRLPEFPREPVSSLGIVVRSSRTLLCR